jgi:hypothetical protein
MANEKDVHEEAKQGNFHQGKPKRGYGGIRTGGTGSAVGRAIGRFAGIVQRPKGGFGERGRVARGRNAFEADVVKGVEDAGDTDEGEVRTHEVPQDDVPSEYLDKK